MWLLVAEKFKEKCWLNRLASFAPFTLCCWVNFTNQYVQCAKGTENTKTSLETGAVFTTLHELNTLENAGKACHGKNSSLLGICKLQRKWSVMNMAPSTAFTILHFFRNLWMGPISSGAGKACHGINTLAYWAFVSYEEKKMLWIQPLVLHS